MRMGGDMPDCKTLHAGCRWFVSVLFSAVVLVSVRPVWADNLASVSASKPSPADGSSGISTLRPEYANSRVGASTDTSAGSPRPEYASSSMSIEWRDNNAVPAQADATDPANDTPANADDLWQRIRDGFKINDVSNPLTAAQEAWYAARPDYVKRMVLRSRRYLYHIVTEVQRRSMPMEIALLPMIESAFNPHAYSTSDASGIWQFIPSTGRNYGLRQDHWYDGRNDITAATNAALDYLGKLYLDFGDWQLALAAYNCGEGCVARAIQTNLQRGLPTDYASLPLSAETRNYVPKLLAVKHLVLDPGHFGVSLDTLPNQPYFSQVAIRSGIDVGSAARLAGMSVQDFTALNPAFQRNLIRSDTPINVLVPVDKCDRFEKNLQTEVWDTWKPEVVQKGEHVASVASRYDTTVARLGDHNSLALKRGRFMRKQTILVPVKGRGVAPALADSRVAAAPDSSSTDTDSGDQHTVDAGETLYSIARRYHTTVGALQQANPGVRLPVRAGLSLQLPRSADAEPDALATPLKKVSYSVKPRHKAVAHRYTVRRGDTLSAIAGRFDVSLSALKSWNPALRKHGRIQPGARLLVSAN
jgi:membrane-bound lytic murein transglycosylase D